MIIDWNENPLRTTVRLSEQEREIFLLKAKLKEYEGSVRMAVYLLDDKAKEKGRYKPDRALTYLRHAQRAKEPDEDGGLSMLEAVTTGCHCGDCTCVPMTCDKCLGEDLLGINTIPGLKSHPAVKIEGAFGRDSERSIAEAIEVLRTYEPSKTGHWADMDEEKFQEYAIEWRQEAADGLVWLEAYGKEKGFLG